MASDGSVVAELKPEPDGSTAGSTAPLSTVVSKPETAGKPPPVGTKPCPPVPKKPPVAHKPLALSASPRHASPPVSRPPAPPSVGGNPHPVRPATLPPSAQHTSQIQGAATAPHASSPDTDRKSVGKTPPPPLPKVPPKGTPTSHKSSSKEPPPRPRALAAPRKPPPPVPAKKPACRKPAVSQTSERETSHSEDSQHKPSGEGSYQQVIVKDNTVAERPVKQTEDSELPSCENEIPSISKPNTYQQVVVEENFIHSAQVNEDAVAEKELVPQHSQPKSFDNEKLKQRSQQTTSFDSLRSYEQVVVEENTQFGSGVDLKAVCKSDKSDHEPEVPETDRNSLDTNKILSSGASDHIQAFLPVQSRDTSKAQITDDQVGHERLSGGSNAELNETKQSTVSGVETTEDSLILEKEEFANNHSVEEKVSIRAPENSENNVRKPRKRPPRPSVLPPPVRPKPKKRVSLLRQVQVTGEDSSNENTPFSPPDVTDSHSSLHCSTESPVTADHSLENVVYQDIDDLGSSPSKSESGNKSTDSATADTTPETSTVKPDQSGADAVVSLESHSQSSVKQHTPSGDGVEEDSAQATHPEDRTAEAEDVSEQSKGSAVNGGAHRENNSCTAGTASHPTVPELESADPEHLATVSRESPDKQKSASLEDVGETSFMLKEIEQLLRVRLGAVQTETEGEETSAKVSDVLSSSQSVDIPVRPPRPKRADRLRKLTIGSSSYDSSSTESLTSVGLPGKKAPPKPKRKNVPGSVNRSLSDVTGMKNYVDQLSKDEEEEEKPFLPPRQQSLGISPGPVPPPLPPRNKSMERATGDSTPVNSRAAKMEGNGKENELSSNTSDRRASAPVVGTNTPTGVLRSSSAVRSGKKHLPRPTRRAPPPPPHPPSRPLSTSAAQVLSVSATQVSPSTDPSSVTGEKAPGYQKISNGLLAAGDDINAVVPKSAVLGCIDSPNTADVSTDHDYHEIPDHLVKDLSEQTEEPAAEKSKENTPPPVLPPRAYKPPQPSAVTTSVPDLPSVILDSSDGDFMKKKNESFDEKCEASPAEEESSLPAVESEEATHAVLPGHLSPEDSASQSSQLSSRPESFCSEVLGSLAHVVGDYHRPVSAHSGSSHSETGSGEIEVPTFDHSSGSESENEEDEEKMRRKREKKVFYIAEEVVKSEEVFVDVLKLLNVDFRVFISGKTEQAGHAIVPTETLNKLLDFLPQLQSFNEMLLKDLKDRIANWEKQKKIADIFVKKGPFLKLYSSYIRNFEHATALLDETCKKHNGFGMALQQFEMSPRCASLALKHYMLKPIQRIPQYKLLLQDYLKHLTPECPDYKDTITALNIVSEVADHANESMRHGDNVQKLLEIQRSLIGQFEVIQPGRILIRQGELMKMSRKEMQPRMFFLFSDVLLYTTPTATGYRLNNILPLQGMKVLPPKLEEFNNEFNIITTQRSFTVATSTPEEREEWLRALWNAIEENSERYHTFKAMQPEPKTSLLDKDFVLGTKAPLWVPDARVTMCMLCLAEFSITWRRHHCRACGRIICGNCSENKAPLRYLMYKPSRVCDECFENLAKEVEEGLQKEQKPQGEKTTSTTGTSPSASPAVTGTSTSSEASGLSFSSIKARFQKIRKSARERRKSGLARPSVLKEVHANDEGSDMSGYLWVAKNKKWKRLWFVVKGKVLYTYKASEDMAAIESMPLLGFEVTRMTSWYQGAEPDLMFELHHQNTQPLVFKPRNPSIGSVSAAGDRNSVTPSEDGQSLDPSRLSPYVKSSADTTTPRLIFRTDSAAATTKWVTVLREASLA